jgi:hypothetical protein
LQKAILFVIPYLSPQSPQPTNDDGRKLFKRQLTFAQWKVLDDLMELLLPIRDVTKLFEGEKYPTLSLTVPVVLHIQGMFQQMRPNDSVTSVWNKMKQGFFDRTQAMINTSEGPWIGVFFDPKTRDSMKGNQCYPVIYNTCFQIYQFHFPPSPTYPEVEEGRKVSLLEKVLQTQVDSQDEFQRYLSSPCCLPDEPQDMWFKKMAFHQIFYLFRKYCSPPGSAASIERLWSTAGNMVSRRRTRLSPDLVNQVLQYDRNSKVARAVIKNPLIIIK